MQHRIDRETISGSNEGVSVGGLFSAGAQVGGMVFKKAPGFFTPFQNPLKNPYDLGLALISPIVGPIILGGLTAIAGFVVAAAATVAIGSLLVGLCALPFNEDFAGAALGLAFAAGAVTLFATVATALLAFLTVIAEPLAIASLVTRSGATIANAFGCLPDDEEETVRYEHVSSPY
ncbi:hypothetical protein BN59_00033 [Legionella massiliensis]|uniref:Uncharacterized protein n=1 Tax=Legionella massiliensis TaxID=1034943 RepID=A0A078KN33_9GAMM|nr:hypothetical protein [Legionella massiliensis]CDZ75775.1 hypothetical protein BN59_00033 [Legionella massiliensis]CEE11513.1 hypothetical protein BN1094_00033 [Legionella massiliensis]